MIPNLPVPFIPPMPAGHPIKFVWQTAIDARVIFGLSLLGMLAMLALILGARIRRLEIPSCVRCPIAHNPAQIELEPVRAMLNSIFGVPKLRVRGCSMWPALASCDRACLGAAGPS